MRASIAWPLIASCSCASGSGFARGHAQLPLDQVEAGDHLGHRMLDLQPGVHLHEVELAALVGDELHGAGVDVADRTRRGHRGRAHLAAPAPPSCPGQAPPPAPSGGAAAPSSRARTGGRRCRACRQTPASRCGAGACRYFSISTRSSPKAGGRLALRGCQRALELRRGFDDAHALAAAAGGGLDQHRIADAVGFARKRVEVLRLAVIAGHQRHAGLLHHLLGRALRAHRPDRARGRPDEDDAGPRAGLGEIRVLRQKPVARMNRLRAACACATARMRSAAQIALPRRRPDRSDSASSHSATCSAPASASEYTATVRMPSRLQVRATRTAISPRLAMRILSNIVRLSPPRPQRYAKRPQADDTRA